ncbi:hypothetical protein DICVIV_11652 [Dictyocaulus viviparus]|uniref:Uncharacterized protein n=1 Tax=Dictyocaulus viviparus TaxID=29172 RepID=A0A0D8XCM2_DICVI|nr:hypothetical protein DICVIV_11652 [Dictyocaulus viviparus]
MRFRVFQEKLSERWRDAWYDRVCRNSLLAVHQHLYRDQYRIEKESKKFQDFFVKEDIDMIRQNFQKNDKSCEAVKEAGAKALISAARRVSNDLKPLKTGEVKLDAWLFDVDWSVRSANEYPEWYFKLFSKRGKAYYDIGCLTSEDVIMKSALVPLIFGMTYGPYPLHRTQDLGWGYLVPCTQDILEPSRSETHSRISQEYQHVCDIISKNRSAFGDIEPVGKSYYFGAFLFYRLPHPLGSQNVGDPLGKHFLRLIESQILRPTRHEEEFFVLLDALKTTKFWTNYAKRFEAEIPVWYEANNGSKLGAIAPAVVPAGTISRRSVHKLWVTLTNESGNARIGTGIKSLVQAPSGEVVIGADVDSQEQWLAALFGDASYAKAFPERYRRPGVTPFSNMMLAGSKANGTDLHSIVAKQLKIDRDQAKVRIFFLICLEWCKTNFSLKLNKNKRLCFAGLVVWFEMILVILNPNSGCFFSIVDLVDVS